MNSIELGFIKPSFIDGPCWPPHFSQCDLKQLACQSEESKIPRNTARFVPTGYKTPFASVTPSTPDVRFVVDSLTNCCSLKKCSWQDWNSETPTTNVLYACEAISSKQ